MTTCRYVEGYGHYLRAHAMNCRDATCEGCQPCTHDDAGNPVKHCTARKTCGQHIGSRELTCPRCIGKTRGDIAAIVKAYTELPAEAAEEGINSEAANLAGPTGDPYTLAIRRQRQWRAGGVDAVEPEDPHHPRSVLGRWEMMLREDYGQPSRRRITLATAATYLDGILDRLAQDDEQDWSLFAAEIRACRSHLEDVLHTARRPERGAPCPACEKAPPLVKRYAHWCDRETCEREHDRSGAADAWRCPSCRAEWTEAEYRLWVADDYLDNAEALTASDMGMIYGVKAGTLRRWANGWTTDIGHERKPIVHKRGYDGSGRQLYDVTDVRKALGDTAADPSFVA